MDWAESLSLSIYGKIIISCRFKEHFHIDRDVHNMMKADKVHLCAQ